jgi:SulP family sulfate permease
LSGPNTPSGISVLLSKHEGKASSSSTPGSDETAKRQFLTSTPNPGKAANSTASSPISSASTPARSSGSSDTVGEDTPLARSPAKVPEVEEAGLPKDKSLLQPKISLGESTSERSPLLRHAKSSQSIRSYTPQSSDSSNANKQQQDKSAKRSWQSYIHAQKNAIWKSTTQSTQQLKKTSFKDIAMSCVVEPAKTLPAVILGILMNLLDGVSYGMVSIDTASSVRKLTVIQIMFPVSSPVFSAFGGIGVSMVRKTTSVLLPSSADRDACSSSQAASSRRWYSAVGPSSKAESKLFITNGSDLLLTLWFVAGQ